MVKRLPLLLALLWTAAITAAYIAVYPAGVMVRELSVPSVFHPALSLTGSVLLLILFLASAAGWGKFFLSAAGGTLLERLLFAFAAGCGVIALAVLSAGVWGITWPLFYWLVLAVGLVLLFTSWRVFKGVRDRTLLITALVSLLPLLSGLLAAMAPPTQFDSLVYHLALPARYLADHRIHYAGHSIFFSFPQNLEMLFQMSLALQGDILANLTSWSFFALTGLAIYAFCHRFFQRSVAVLSAVLWYFTPAALFLSTGTYVDLALAFFVFLSLYGLLLWRETGQRIWLYAAGIMGGIACGTKYTAAAAILLLFLLVFFYFKERRSAFLYGLSAVLTFSPWIIKNIVFLKNPIAPWGATLFRSSLIDPGVAAGYFAHISGHGSFVTTLSGLLALPWKLTASGFQFGGAFDIIGPLFLLFIPLLLFQTKIDKIKIVLYLFSAGFLVVWFFTGKVLRFLFPVMPLGCILAALGFSFLYSRKGAVRAIALLLLAIGLSHNLLMFHWVMSGIEPYATVLGGESRSSYLGRKVIGYKAIEAVNALPVGGVVLFWGETRGYFCRYPAVVPTVFDRHPLVETANAATTPDEMAETLRRRSVTYLLVNDHEVQRLSLASLLTPKGRENLETLESANSALRYQDATCRIYEIGTKTENTDKKEHL